MYIKWTSNWIVNFFILHSNIYFQYCVSLVNVLCIKLSISTTRTNQYPGSTFYACINDFFWFVFCFDEFHSKSSNVYYHFQMIGNGALETGFQPLLYLFAYKIFTINYAKHWHSLAIKCNNWADVHFTNK